MGRSWYDDWEDEQEEANESFGRDFVASLKKEKNEMEEVLKPKVIVKLYEHKSGQMSLFEELLPCQKVGTTKGIEYVRLSKREEPVRERTYVEEYVPEMED